MASKTVLLVEDDETLRGLYAEILREAGYTVVEADSGEKALTFFGTGEIPLVITDMVMEGMNGLELTDQIKKAFPKTQIILLTSHVDPILASHAQSRGLFWYMTKPLENLDDLAKKAAEAIGSP